MTRSPTQALTNPRLGLTSVPTFAARGPQSGGDFALPTFTDTSTFVLRELTELRQQIADLLSRISTVRRWSGAIATLDDSRFELRMPLPIGFEEAEGTVVAYSHDFENYASGETEYEALDELRKVIVDDYESLEREADRLGPVPSRVFARMTSLIRRAT